MEIEIVLLTMIVSLLVAFAFHSLQKKRNSSRHLGDIIFTPILIISLLLLPISIFIVGGWNGLFLGAVGVYLLFPSLSGLIVTQLLKKYK